MKIWKLSPINLDFAGWCCSTYKDDVIIRAEDEEKARDIATQNFGIFAKKVSSTQETPRSPWNDSTVVKCIELSNSKYSIEGPAKLLEPNNLTI